MFAVFLALILIATVYTYMSVKKYKRLDLFEQTGRMTEARIISFRRVRKDEYYKNMGMTATDARRLIYCFTLSYTFNGIEHTVVHRDEVLSKRNQKALARDGCAYILVSPDNPEDIELKEAVENKNRHILNIVAAIAAVVLFIALSIYAGR